jgi:hypothetical protein
MVEFWRGLEKFKMLQCVHACVQQQEDSMFSAVRLIMQKNYAYDLPSYAYFLCNEGLVCRMKHLGFT